MLTPSDFALSLQNLPLDATEEGIHDMIIDWLSRVPAKLQLNWIKNGINIVEINQAFQV